MGDRHTHISKGQEDPLAPSEIDATNSPSIGQVPSKASGDQFEWVDKDPTVDNFTIINNAGILKVADRVEQNIMLLAFYRCVDLAKSLFNLIDGFIDEYEDETGIDTVNSLNESYDSSNDLYSPANEAFTKLLLHGDGTDGATTITDETGKTVTNTADQYDSYTKLLWHCDVAHDGSAEAVATTGQTVSFVGTADCVDTQKKWTKSLLLDGDSDYCTIPDSDDWAFGTGNFTIDFWVRFSDVDTYKYHRFLDQTQDAQNQWNFAWQKSATLTRLHMGFYIGDAYSAYFRCDWSPTVNTWYHIAFVRAGIGTNESYFFINGVKTTATLAYGAWDGNFTAITGNLCIGSDTTMASPFAGFMDELRISKGIARWTVNFTPPIQPYGRVYNETTSKKFGAGALIFDGSGSYCSLADSDDWNFGTGDFTIDFWIYFIDNSPSQTIYNQQNAFDVLSILKHSDGYLSLFSSFGGGDHYIWKASYNTANLIWNNNQWYHLAFERIGSSAKMFVDGISQTLTESIAFGTNDLGDITAPLWIGRGVLGGNRYVNGYIDEFRISKGTAQWTENFTPPTNAYTYPIKNNMTLISNDVTAEVEPTQVRVVVFEEDVDAITLNTDLKLWVSIDNGANYEQITLTDEGDWQTGKRILSGIADVTARTGTAILYKITTHNNKDCKIHGTACNWN